ncbi:hypothetical protein G2W53_000018 [Senna tora]|uniref:Uncharacterized protein n=1 Tax=Senna tora TaxID=362788 RepID=A0A834XCQ8_9FABA|nr:hypothetical protein G2W53_000018 [Senna tora]
MVSIVNENGVKRAGVEHLATASAHTRTVAQNHIEEVLFVCIFSSVILRNSLVNIRALGFVDDNTRFWIFGVICNIVIHKDDDVFFCQATFPKYLIGMANVGLKESRKGFRISSSRNRFTYVSKSSKNGIESGAGGKANGERLGIARLGVELHVEEGKAGVESIDLSRRIGEKSVLLASAGGYHTEQRLLEIFDDLEGGSLGVQSLRLVVGYQLLRTW